MSSWWSDAFAPGVIGAGVTLAANWWLQRPRADLQMVRTSLSAEDYERLLRANDGSAEYKTSLPMPTYCVRLTNHGDASPDHTYRAAAAGGPLTWAQYETYVAGSDQPGQGLLIQHSVFVDRGSFFRLSRDVGQLTGSIHGAFRTAIGADPTDAKWITPDSVLAKDPRTAILSREPGEDGIDMVAIALTPEERYFICSALIQWGGAATGSPLPIKALGFAADWTQFDDLVDRLDAAIAAQEPLSDLDWARALFLTEVSWASNLVGAGLDFRLVTGISDEEAVKLLRVIQQKISSRYHADLLFPNASRPRRTEAQGSSN